MARWLMVFGLLLVVGWPDTGTASVETLLMPGPVIEGHAEYEKNCDSCHQRFDKRAQSRLCLDCHKEVAADISGGEGLHGRRAADPKSECNSCHGEHQGRDADIVLLVRETFDHDATDFALEGKHLGARCVSCHVAGKKNREAPGVCIDCHRKQDAHRGNMGEKCGDCHKSTDWKRDVKFEHDKTKFALNNRHSETSCAGCHPDARYKDTQKNCAACHRLDDVHGGRLGNECEQCHSDKAWKEHRFDHDRKTKFVLRHKHRTLACSSCHRTADAKDKPAKTCVGCHSADDVHKGRNGERCADCHNEKSWKDAKVDHLRISGYPLRGAHGKAACGACHRGPVHEVALERACAGCHRNDDIHGGKLGASCEQCHSELGWNKNLAFDHDITRFPLIGMHATTPCESCHVTTTYRDTARECNDCHERTDSHKGAQGNECGKCHTPNGWRLWKFDHAKDAGFALDGGHKGLACDACHRPGSTQKPATACVTCHEEDDAHRGGFGKSCERCHVTTRFDDLRLLGQKFQTGRTPRK